MKRFFALYILGGLLMTGGLLILVLGLHPDHFAPFAFLAKGGASLVLGAALLAPGLWGLAELCEEHVARLKDLLATRSLPEPDEAALEARTPAEVLACEERFWRFYHRATLAIGAFVFAVLLLSVLLGNLPFIAYISGLALGTGLLGTAAVALAGHSLLNLWRLLDGLDETVFILEEQPDKPPEPPPFPRRRLRRPPSAAPA